MRHGQSDAAFTVTVVVDSSRSTVADRHLGCWRGGSEAKNDGDGGGGSGDFGGGGGGGGGDDDRGCGSDC